jgi:hypothetical protein
MSNSIIEINETVYNLDVETSYSDTINNLTVEISSNATIEISSGYVGTVVFASDVIGLDSYIGNFIDSYEIDCGSP